MQMKTTTMLSFIWYYYFNLRTKSKKLVAKRGRNKMRKNAIKTAAIFEGFMHIIKYAIVLSQD